MGESLAVLNEMENVIADIIAQYEQELVKKKMSAVFDNMYNQVELEKTLAEVENDIRVCRELSRRIRKYCRDRATNVISTK